MELDHHHKKIQKLRSSDAVVDYVKHHLLGHFHISYQATLDELSHDLMKRKLKSSVRKKIHGHLGALEQLKYAGNATKDDAATIAMEILRLIGTKKPRMPRTRPLFSMFKHKKKETPRPVIVRPKRHSLRHIKHNLAKLMNIFTPTPRENEEHHYAPKKTNIKVSPKAIRKIKNGIPKKHHKRIGPVLQYVRRCVEAGYEEEVYLSLLVKQGWDKHLIHFMHQTMLHH